MVNELIETVDNAMDDLVNSLEVKSNAPVAIQGRSRVAGQSRWTSEFVILTEELSYCLCSHMMI